MLGLTREMGAIGAEHLASSENTRVPEFFSDWQWSALLPHELTHSAGLNKVQRNDWASFLNARLHSTAPAGPTEWLRRSGYRLVFSDTPSEAFASHHTRGNRLDLRHTLGLVLRAGSSGEVDEIIWNSPAFEAGLVARATILSVNGSRFMTNTIAPSALRTAIRAPTFSRKEFARGSSVRNAKHGFRSGSTTSRNPGIEVIVYLIHSPADGLVLEGVDYAKLKLFVLSIVWRASAALGVTSFELSRWVRITSKYGRCCWLSNLVTR